MSSNTVNLPLWSTLCEFTSGESSTIVQRLCEMELDHRMQTAFRFLNKGLNERDALFRFSSYWIALEVLVNGKSGTIRTRLQRCYEQKSHKYVDQDLHFATLSGMRHNLFHHGRFVDLAPYQERMMLAYFWDIVADILGVKCPQFARVVIETEMAQQEITGLTSIGRL